VRSAPWFVLLALAGCDRAPRATTAPEAPAWFLDVAGAAGLSFHHVSGAHGRYLLPEIMGGGVGFLDYDGDGRLDVYAVQSGSLDPGEPVAPGNRLFRNVGGGAFAEVPGAGGAAGRGYGMGCAAGDYDGDGDVDLYVTNLGPNVLYRNDRGTFVDVTAGAGVGDPGWSTSAAFFDYDRDGDLDLFVCNYVAWRATPAFLEKVCHSLNGVRDYCSPQAYGAPSASTLYQNQGDGTFADVSLRSRIASRPGTALGVVCTDLDGDGWVDVYVANDQMPSFAWISRKDGTFVESGVELGIAVNETGKSQAGMGVVSADVDADGDLDLWKVHLYREGHILYQNRGASGYVDATARFGLLAPTRRFTGFGTGVFDADLDGLLDILVVNGRVELHADLVRSEDPYAEPDQFLRQREKGVFADVSAAAGPAFGLVENGRGAAFGDYDDDGDVDVVLVNRDGPIRLMRNDSPRRGAFVVVRAVDRGRDAHGARVRVVGASRSLLGEVQAASSYLATNDPRVHFGLGRDFGPATVEVTWADGGAVERFGPFDTGPGIALTLRRGEGAAVK
jgi:enediyne biosynthesis protein E4